MIAKRGIPMAKNSQLSIKCTACMHLNREGDTPFCSRIRKDLDVDEVAKPKRPYVYFETWDGRNQRIVDGCFEAFVIWAKRTE
jgi:hypothetical protein